MRRFPFALGFVVSALAAALSAALAAAPALATVKVMNGEPPEDLAGLIQAERNFAMRAAQTSIRDAFFEAFDDEGIVFRPTPVNAKQFYRDRPSNPGPALHWEPSYAEISSSGDLGWTTGPWDYRGPNDKEPTAFGHFATVWRLGLDHKWRVLADYGHSHPKGGPETLSFARLGGEKAEPRLISMLELTRNARGLFAADSAYSQALAHEGVGAALARFADPDVRVYRDGLAPLLGIAAAGKALAHEWDHGVVAWGIGPGAISKSGDLAFTYGTVDLPAGKKGEPTRRGVMRIWRHAPSEDWKLALDVTIPLPLDPSETRPAPPKTAEPKTN